MRYSDFIGVDVSKDKLDVFSRKKSMHRIIQNDEKSVRDFFSRFNRDVLVIIENTGGYENACVNTLIDLGFKIHKTNKSLCRKAKTDKLDAIALAKYGKENHEELKIYNKPKHVHEKIKALTTYLNYYKRERVKEKNRLQSPGCKIIVETIRTTLEKVDQIVDSIELQIKELINDDEELKKKINLISEYKGIGSTTAINLLSNLPELGKVGRNQIVALAGMAPIVKDSGKINGYRTTKCMGRPVIRNILFFPTMTAIVHNKSISEYWNKKLGMESIEKSDRTPSRLCPPKMKVVTACMRKIIIQLNAIVRDGKILTQL
jgi:transposase